MNRIYVKFTIMCGLAAPLATQPAQAQRVALTLRQCLELATAHNPSIMAADKSVERARTLQGTAWDIDKTGLTLSQDPTSGGSPDNALSLTQSIDFPTLYIARHRQLKSETKAESARREVVLTQLMADVSSAYMQLAYEYELMRVLCEQDSVLTHYHNIVTGHRDAGDVSRVATLRAEMMVKENRLERDAAFARIEAQRARLASLTGADGPVAIADTCLRKIDFTPQPYSFTLSPRGQYAGSQVDIAEKALGVARNGFAPSLSLSLRNQLVFTGWDPYKQHRTRFDGGNFMGFEVGIGLPLFFGATKAKVRAARQERDIVRLEMQQQQAQADGDYALALSRYNAAKAKVDFYEGEGIDKYKESVRIAGLEYANGEIGYYDYMDMLKGLVEMQMKRADAINEYNQSVIDIMRLTGFPDGMGGTPR